MVFHPLLTLALALRRQVSLREAQTAAEELMPSKELSREEGSSELECWWVRPCICTAKEGIIRFTCDCHHLPLYHLI